jgi:hypothetical protein
MKTRIMQVDGNAQVVQNTHTDIDETTGKLHAKPAPYTE